MSYKETIDYLFSRLPMFERQGAAAYKADLTNTIELLQQLGNPHHSLKCIHIAGTNGKGSVSHMIASVLQESGYKTGLYISPHYIDFRERIKINGAWISEEYVIQFTERIQDLIERIQPSFFEITVAMAFDYFRREMVDYAVIETGLGGRLDSTNVITPLLSVVTNISFDHMQFLGNSLSEIAEEKAGIIKPKVPVVIGERNNETNIVFNRVAQRENSPIFFAEDLIQTERIDTLSDTENRIRFNGKAFQTEIKTEHIAGYQVKNLRTSLAAIDVLRRFYPNLEKSIEDRFIPRAIEKLAVNTHFIGRWQIWQEEPYIIFDSAHNEAGIKEAIAQLQRYHYSKLHIVFGCVKDKSIEAILNQLPKEAQYYFCKPSMPRGKDHIELQKEAAVAGLHGKAFESCAFAFQEARSQTKVQDLLLVCGSIFVLGEILQAVGIKNDSRESIS